MSTTMTAAERRYEHGFWVPIHYGNRFRIARNITVSRRYGQGASKGEEQRGDFATLAEAQTECNKLNS